MAVFSLRIPAAWRGQVDSGSVRGSLAAYLQRPRKLPPDPGPGEEKISLSLPERAVKVVSGLLDDTESGALRRVIAENIGALPAPKPVPRLPAPPQPVLVPSRAWALPPASPRMGRDWPNLPLSQSNRFLERRSRLSAVVLVGVLSAGLIVLLLVMRKFLRGASARTSAPSSVPVVQARFKGWSPVV